MSALARTGLPMPRMLAHGAAVGLVVLQTAVLSACASDSAQGRGADSADVMTVEQLAKALPSLDGRSVKVHGYLVIEPENRNLRQTAAKYGENEGECVGVEMTDELFKRREEYSRRLVVLSGTVTRSLCGGDTCLGSCTAAGLADLVVVATEGSFDDLSPAAALGRRNELSIGSEAPDHDELRAFATELNESLRTGVQDRGSRAKLEQLFAQADRQAVRVAIAEQASRLNWLLFDWSESIARLLMEQPRGEPQIFQALQDSSVGYLCFCRDRRKCDARSLSEQRIYFSAAGEPYACLPTRKEGGRWYLDAQFVLGPPYERP
jgi:hypothetical protein